jgi:hypothetical protein
MAVYLVFGDLHGRILPAFRLAAAWSRAHDVRIDGILQVGDLGYFPDNSRLDKATRRFALDDPMELGAQLVTQPSPEADAVFAHPDTPDALWFTAGNHEDFDALLAWERGAGPRATHFAVDDYLRVQCVKDGGVATLPGGLRVAALWGVDRRTRSQLPPRGWIQPKAATRLLAAEFDVLLCHDCPAGAMHPGSGSEDVERVVRYARPRFVFFGHYRGKGTAVAGDFGASAVFHMAGMELRRHRCYAEEGCVGVLRWEEGAGEFAFIDADWLLQFPREQWQAW